MSLEYSSILEHPLFPHTDLNTSLSLPQKLCHHLLQRYAFIHVKYSNFYDEVFVQVMLCWYLQDKQQSLQIILKAIASIFESVPNHASKNLCLDDVDPSLLARQIYMLVVASQLHLLLWIGGNASDLLTSFLPEPHLEEYIPRSVAVLMGAAIRTAILYGSLVSRTDIVLTLLKQPLAVPSPEQKTEGEVHAHNFEIPKGDAGYAHFVNLSRSEAITALSDLPEGSFILRPSDTKPGSELDALAFYLSMRVDEEIGVKHAVIRRKRVLLSISSTQRSLTRDSWTYRCGKVGPFGSLLETLKAVGELMPSPLLIDDASAVQAAKSLIAARHTLTGRPLSSRWDPNADFWQGLASEEVHPSERELSELGFDLSEGISSFMQRSLVEQPAPVGYDVAMNLNSKSGLELTATVMLTLVATLSVRALYQQLRGVNMEPLISQDSLTELMQSTLQGISTSDSSPSQLRDICASLLTPLATYILSSEKMLMYMTCPPNLTKSHSFAPDMTEEDKLILYLSESVMEIINSRIALKPAKVPGTDTHAFFFEYHDALKVLNAELQSNEKLNQIAFSIQKSCNDEEDTTANILHFLKRSNTIKSYSKVWDSIIPGSHALLRYLDPWEVH